ncbi:MAG: glycosyltransferase [Actinomycetota bacterium]
MAAEGHDVVLAANAGGERDGLGAATIVAPSAIERLFPSVDVVHVWGLLEPSQLRPLLQVRGRAALVVSPLTQVSATHLRRRRWKKLPYLWLWRAAASRERYGLHFFSSHETRDALERLRPATFFEASAGVFPAPITRAPDHVGDYLLFMGRNDVHHKGLDILIDAYALAVRDGLVLPLVIAGREEGDSHSYLEQAIAREGLSGSVSLIGSVSEGQKWDLLADARALVFLSRWDGPPRPIREAIAAGLPPIVSDGTNMAGLVEHFGAGCRTSTTLQSVASCLRAAEDPHVVLRWQAGVVELRDELAWERVADRYVGGYADLIHALGRAPA